MTKEQLEIAAELHDIKDGPIHRWLQGQLESVKSTLASTADEVRMRWLQGEAQRLTKILDEIESAFDHMKEERERERVKRLRQSLTPPPGRMQAAF